MFGLGRVFSAGVLVGGVGADGGVAAVGVVALPVVDDEDAVAVVLLVVVDVVVVHHDAHPAHEAAAGAGLQELATKHIFQDVSLQSHSRTYRDYYYPVDEKSARI